MKTIDSKSLLIGICATLVILTLTSGKNSDDQSPLQISPNMNQLLIFNPKTKTIYEYSSKMRGYEKLPINTYKVNEDGSMLTRTE